MKFIILICSIIFASCASAQNNGSPVIPEADGFTILPGAALQPDKNITYKAIYDATQMPADAKLILPALNMAGSELNALGVCNISLSNAKFVIVFHDDAIDGILDEDHYKIKYGTGNPNLKVLAELKKAGVQLFVCGQNLLALKIDTKSISTDVTLASDALIVLMTFQNAGYALMSF
jgi:intracellular sulfur oxidation DsrE/DsrF family protein